MDFARFSNPHACDAHPMAPGKQVRFMVDEKHHAHGCVEQVVYGGAWVKLDNGEKLFVKKKDLRVENPSGESIKQATYSAARADAQRRANELGFDHGLSWNKSFREWTIQMLPRRENRYGHELQVEVVHCESKKCQQGHGWG